MPPGEGLHQDVGPAVQPSMQAHTPLLQRYCATGTTMAARLPALQPGVRSLCWPAAQQPWHAVRPCKPSLPTAAALCQHAAFPQRKREIAEKRASLAKKQAEGLQFAARQARAELQEIQRVRQQQEAEAAAVVAGAAKQQKAEQAFQHQRKTGWVPSVGQTVYVPRLQGYAEVAAVGASGKLTLKKGLMKIAAGVDEVRRKK